VKKNPKQFGYNGVKGGMSGVGFVMGWVSANSGLGDKLEKGPYSAGDKATIEKSLAGLKDFNTNVVMTPGNAGTLDMLNRGEIADGPGVGRHVLHLAGDGKMSPKIKLSLPQPGLPGQPMYYVIPAKGGERGAREEVHRPGREPGSAGDGIVKQFNWYPGIDPQHVQAKMTPAAGNKLFTDISPGDLAKYGKPFRCPITSRTSSRVTSGSY
jgi:hypothetical protein